MQNSPKDENGMRSSCISTAVPTPFPPNLIFTSALQSTSPWIIRVYKSLDTACGQAFFINVTLTSQISHSGAAWQLDSRWNKGKFSDDETVMAPDLYEAKCACLDKSRSWTQFTQAHTRHRRWMWPRTCSVCESSQGGLGNALRPWLASTWSRKKFKTSCLRLYLRVNLRIALRDPGSLKSSRTLWVTSALPLLDPLSQQVPIHGFADLLTVLTRYRGHVNQGEGRDAARKMDQRASAP